MTALPESHEAIRRQVQQWRDELIDLTLRNKLLNYKPTKSSSLEIVAPSRAEILQGLRGKGWSFHYPPIVEAAAGDDLLLAAAVEAEAGSTAGATRRPDELEAARVSASDLSRILHNLQRRASTEYADKGLRVLYLGLGSLLWSDTADGDLQRSPLVLVPVQLDRATSGSSFRLTATDDDTVFNPALVVKLEQEHGIVLDIDAEDLDVEDVFSRVRQAVEGQRRWKVEDNVVLAPFSFHKEAMYRDLKDNEAAICSHELIGALSAEADDRVRSDLVFEPIDEEELDVLAPPEESAAILDADSTQRQCIAAAVDGRTFVVHGPPGTGKSQTIANVIAELLGQDKTVLFVSEKAAALDVVKSRLDRSGLGHYVLELHSHKATRREVAKELGRSLETRPRAARSMSSEDLAEVTRRREALSTYAEAMNETRPGLAASLHELIGRRSRLSDLSSAPAPDGFDAATPRAVLDDVNESASDWARAWGPVERGDDFLWRDLTDPGAVERSRSRIAHDLQTLEHALAEARRKADAFAEGHLLDPPTTMDDLERLSGVAELVARRPEVPEVWLTDALAPVDDLQRRRAEQWEEQRHDIGALEALAGSPCDDLDPAAAAELVERRGRVAALEPAPTLTGSIPPQDLRRLVDEIGAAAGLATDIDGRAQRLATALAVSCPAPDVRSAAAIAHAAALGATTNRPEGSWFQPEGLRAARAAAQVLHPIVERHRALVAQISATFAPQVTNLDVEAFYDGPQDLAPKLSRLSSRGRANRAQLKACAPNGKVTKEVIAALPAVRQWRATHAELMAVEPSLTAALGSRYYQRQDTDLGALDQALAIADQALALLSSLGGSDALGAALGADAPDPTAIAEQGRTLLELLERWQAPSASFVATGLPESLSDAPLGTSATHLSAVHQGLAHLTGAVDRVAAASGPHGLDDLVKIAELGVAIDDRSTALATSQNEDVAQLGLRYVGVETDWASWAEDRSWVDAIRTTIGQPIDPDQARLISASTTEAGLISTYLELAEKHLDATIGLFLEDRAAVLREDCARVDDASELVGALASQLADIEEWASYTDARERLAALGLNQVVDHIEEACIPREEVVGTIERAVLTAIVDDILVSDRRLRPSRSTERDDLVARFRELDREVVAHAAARVIDVCNAKRPSTVVGEAATIQKEAMKKTRHRPIKTLLTDAGRVAQALRPCFMMSPLTVSQFLPPTLRFDAVIFDEASQVRPCDAANAIYRGTQLIVAGDDKQLPPTSFFDRTTSDTDDEYEESQLDAFDSVLDLCNSAGEIPSLPLRWHYRSRHESLITYSNRAFYEGRLVTYPGALDEGEDVGLHLIHVPDGVYRRGEGRDNPIEAQAVVERVLHHAKHHPDLTIGVVAFSEAQASRIQYELEAALRQHPELEANLGDDRLDGFFVKNLESVQGDERDIIIFSIGYGRNEDGKLSMNFGPLNREGGQRRLNVAITRARRRVEVVTSITAGDFAASPNPGVNHLRRYLDFAERGMVALSTDDIDSEADAESPFEEDVLAVIRGLGYDPQPQVGQAGYRIDIGIRDPAQPGRFVLGVECDGAAYHSSRAARDRDRLRQEVLEGLDWRLHRIWGPSWYRDRSGETARLKQAIDDAIKGKTTAAAQPSVQPTVVEVAVDEVDFDDLPSWSGCYERFKPDYEYYGEPIDDPTNAQPLRRSIFAIVEAEGPVSTDAVVSHIREGWGIGRMSARLRGVVDAAIVAMTKLDQLHRTDDGFLYVVDAQLEVVRHADPHDATTVRKVAEVSRGEIEVALVNILRDAGSATNEELTTKVARLFGWGRRGADITAALRKAVAHLESTGVIADDAAGRHTLRGP